MLYGIIAVFGQMPTSNNGASDAVDIATAQARARAPDRPSSTR